MERITDRKWLQKEDNLIGKTLCIICRGFNGVNPEDGVHTLRFSSTEYAIDVERIDPDPMKAVDYNTGEEVSIPLDPTLSAIENGKRYFDNDED